MTALKIELPNAESTRQFGRLLTEQVANDENLLLALSGDLGAGKTTFAQGVGEGLGLKEDVNSPTFTMLNEYQSGRLPFYHFDLYRLKEDFKDKSFSSHPALSLLQEEFDEFLCAPGLILVEWAELGKPLFIDREYLELSFQYVENSTDSQNQINDGRLVLIRAQGKSLFSWLDTFCLNLKKNGLYKQSLTTL